MEYDVIVIGAGLSGLIAAARARPAAGRCWCSPGDRACSP